MGAKTLMNLNEYLAEEGFALTGEFREATSGEYYLGGSGKLWQSSEPTIGKYLILRKLEEGEEPNRANLFTDIYLDIAEAGYELTGEYRRARKGEVFWDGARVRTDAAWSVALVNAGGETYLKYLILKKLKRFFEFDGQKFEVPEGFEFERVGLVTGEDVGKWAPVYLTVKRREGPYFCPDRITETNWKTFDLVTPIFTKKETN